MPFHLSPSKRASDETLQEMRAAVVLFLKTHCVISGDQETLTSTNGADAKWLVDTRVALLEPRIAYRIAALFWDIVSKRSSFQLCCVEMTGIPIMVSLQAFGLAHGRPINGFIVRKERKDTGRRRQIEGSVLSEPIVFLDDIVNAGASLSRARAVLHQCERDINEVVALVDFGTSEIGEMLLRDGISLHSIISLDELGLERSKQPDTGTSANELFQILWKFDPAIRPGADLVPRSTPCIDETTLYYGTDSGDFYALDRFEGSVRWSFKTNRERGKGIRSSPIAHGELVYFGAYDGNFYALERSTGNLRWQHYESDWIGSSPCVAQELNHIFVGVEHAKSGARGGLIALDAKTGIKAWEIPFHDYVHGSPTFLSDLGLVVIGNNDGEVVCAHGASGEIQWRTKTGGGVKSGLSYDLGRQVLFVGSFDKCIYALDAVTGSIKWNFETGSLIYSTPLFYEDRLFVSSTDKCFYVLDAISGSLIAKCRVGTKLFGSPILFRGKLYFGSTAGTVFEFDREHLRVSGKHQFLDKVINPIVFSEIDQTLYIVTADAQIIAVQQLGERRPF